MTDRNDIHADPSSIGSLPITFYHLDKDPKFQEALASMLQLGGFAGDSLVTFGKQLTFLRDPRFVASLEAQPQSYANAFVWRLHVAVWAAGTALKRDGDFVECGVHEGMTSTMVTHYWNFRNIGTKRYFLYDTFEGIPSGYLEDIDPAHNHAGYLKPGLYETTCGHFADYDNVSIIKGELPGTLERDCPLKIAFLHMDLGNYQSERDCMAFLIDRMVPGGIVLFHTFGWKTFSNYKIADEDFIRERNLHILELPTGQGLMIT